MCWRLRASPGVRSFSVIQSVCGGRVVERIGMFHIGVSGAMYMHSQLALCARHQCGTALVNRELKSVAQELT